MDVTAAGAPGKRRLTIGHSPGRRAALAVLGIILLCGGLPVGGVVTMLAFFLTGGAVTGELTPTAAALGWVAGVGYAVGIGFLMLGNLRSGFWLDGTVVIQRKAITTRRVDLATAEVAGDRVATPVRLGENTWGQIVSAAVRAHDPRTGVKIFIPVHTPGRSRLPSDELTAIADAIMARRQPTDPGYRTAEALAQELRRIAASPFPI